MRRPQAPPLPDLDLRPFNEPLTKFFRDVGAKELFQSEYLHWDQLRRRWHSEGVAAETLWQAIKMHRRLQFKQLPLLDIAGAPFQFFVPDLVQEQLHHIDMGAAGSIGIPEPITNAQTRDQYYVRSLVEEAITSSQLEGAVTTREVAKEMIRTGRQPRNRSERMILNNYLTMRQLSELKTECLSPDTVFAIHRLVTDNTLDNPYAAGRLRRPEERRVVADPEGEIFHDPPPADQLPDRLKAMCEFANGESPEYFIHPVVRAIILHFWLAYDHPFVDGNGRTARALFYWTMLHHDYWLFEFISISNVLLKAPTRYARSFLYTETDDNDVTYFIVAQTKVIRRAIEELHAYIDRKSREIGGLQTRIQALRVLNHRQVALINHALKHPHQEYTIASHRKSHNVVYQTARMDLLDLCERGALNMTKRGKTLVFTPPADLSVRLKQLEPAENTPD